VDDINLIITAISETSGEILERNEAKQETMYGRIEVEMKGVQQTLYSSHVVSRAPSSSSEGIEVGDEPSQLRRLTDVAKAPLRRVQEEKEQATETLKQVKEEALEKHRAVKKDKDDL
jgi:LysM repeat protein